MIVENTLYIYIVVDNGRIMSGNLGKYDHSRIIVRDTMKKKPSKMGILGIYHDDLWDKYGKQWDNT
jgi:hypothetical protein